MAQLTTEQIADLESRGIKPGVKLFDSARPFRIIKFTSWDQFEVDKDGDIWSIYCNHDQTYDWLKSHRGRYATPVSAEPAPDPRRHEITKLALSELIKLNLGYTPEKYAEMAVAIADNVIARLDTK